MNDLCGGVSARQVRSRQSIGELTEQTMGLVNVVAFDIESAICAALADHVWRANGASDRGVAVRLQGQRKACGKWSPGF